MRRPFPPLVSTCLPARLPACLPACRTCPACAAAASTATASTGVGHMQLQRRPRESLTPQQLREWYTGWGCRGGRAATAVTAATAATTATAATGGGQMQLQRRLRESLTPRQLREWYTQTRGYLSTVRCPYVIRTGDRTGQACGTLSHTQSRCFARLSVAWRSEFGDEAKLPTWLEQLGQGVDIYALDYDAILTAMYALPTSADRVCYLCVPPDPGIAPAALGAGEAAALGASVSLALGTGEAAASSAGESATTPAKALYTFTLESGASRSFFRDSTTPRPLSRPVPVSLADPSGDPVRATSSTVLPCHAVPSGTLSGLYLPSFSTNLVAGSTLQDAGVHQFTPAYERVTHCTCAQTGRHLATFIQQPGSGLYTLTTESPQVAASPSAPGQLVLPPLPPSPAPPCLPCVEGRQRAAPHSSSFPPTEAPLQTLHLDLRERFGTEFPVLRLHSDRGGEFSSDLLAAFCAEHGIRQTFTLPASPQQNGVAERRIGLVMEVARTSMIHAAAPHFLWPFAVRYTAHQLNLWPRISLPETSPTLLWTGKVGDASRFRVWGARAFVCDTTANKLSAHSVPCVFLGFVPDAPGWQFYHPTSRRVFSFQDVTFDESVPFYRLFPYHIAPLPPRRSSLLQVDPPPLNAPVEVTGDSGPAEGGPARGTASGGAEPGGAEPGGAELGGAEPGGAEPGDAEPRGAEPGGAETGGAEPGREDSGGAEPGGTESGGAAPGGAEASGEQSPWGGRLRSRSAGTSPLHSHRRLPLSPQQLREWYVGRQGRAAGARGPAAGGAGAGVSATGVVSAGGSGAAAGAGAGGSRAAEGAGAGGSGAAAGAGAGGFGAAAGAGAEGSVSAVARSPWSSRLRPCMPLTSQQLHDWYGRRQGRASGARGSTAGGTSAGVTGAGSGAGPGGAPTRDPGSGGAATGDTKTGDPGTGGASSGGAAAGGAGPRRAGAEDSGAAGGTGAAGAGGAAQPRLFFTPPSPSSQPPSDSVPCQVLSLPSSTCLPLQPGSSLPAPSPYTEQIGGLTERGKPASRPVSPVHSGRPGRRVPRSHQPAVTGTHLVVRRPSSPPQRFPLPSPPASSLHTVPEPESNRTRVAHSTVTRLLATVVTDPSFESAAVSALVAELVDFVAACRLDYAAILVAESESVCPPSVGGECALGTDVLEDRQEDLECLAATVPHLVSMLLAPEGDPDAPDIPTPCSYAEAIVGTYVDEVPPPGANIVSGMWIFRVKRPPGSPLVFKARYVARGFSQREGVYFFQTFSPIPKMTTFRVLLHVAAQRDYELHSLDFNTAFLQGSLHEEIWLRRPSGFTGSFPPATQWSLWRLVYGLCQAPREWHDTLRTTLADLGFAPSTADPSLFLRTDTLLPPFYILVYLGLQITRDRARRTIILTHSHMVQQVLQRFGFTWSSPQPTPLATGHSLSAPPSNESVEPSGPYPELVGCLICEAKIYATAMAAQELRWLTYLLTDLGERPRSPPVQYVDNKAAIALCEEHRLEHRTKHIALRYFLAQAL
ncbi:unnamed protein product [Closterium sp. NIES-54]